MRYTPEVRSRFRSFLASCVPLGFIALAVPPSCTSTANISDMYMSLDSDGSRKREIFFTDTTEIHCIGEGGFGRPDVTVTGFIRQIRAWDFTNNQDNEVNRTYGDVDVHPQAGGGANAPPTKIDIKFERVDKNNQPSDTAPYPQGSFICEMQIDGVTAKRIPFNIEFPPCPTSIIADGQPCLGFYTDQTQCPAGGNGGDGPNCQCTDTKGWDCSGK